MQHKSGCAPPPRPPTASKIFLAALSSNWPGSWPRSCLAQPATPLPLPFLPQPKDGGDDDPPAGGPFPALGWAAAAQGESLVRAACGRARASAAAATSPQRPPRIRAAD